MSEPTTSAARPGISREKPGNQAASLFGSVGCACFRVKGPAVDLDVESGRSALLLFKSSFKTAWKSERQGDAMHGMTRRDVRASVGARIRELRERRGLDAGVTHVRPASALGW